MATTERVGPRTAPNGTEPYSEILLSLKPQPGTMPSAENSSAESEREDRAAAEESSAE